ncbi:unnamed protein product [Effrenium voratum]|nr:unnamed protein product [Effrenium voratum]
MALPGAFASRFNGLERRMPGCYALIVHGRLPDFTADDEDYEPEEADTPNGDTPNGDASSAAAGSRRGKSRAGVSDNTPSAEHAVSEHTESDEDFDIHELLKTPQVSPSPGVERLKTSKVASPGKRRREAGLALAGREPLVRAEAGAEAKGRAKEAAAEEDGGFPQVTGAIVVEHMMALKALIYTPFLPAQAMTSLFYRLYPKDAEKPDNSVTPAPHWAKVIAHGEQAASAAQEANQEPSESAMSGAMAGLAFMQGDPLQAEPASGKRKRSEDPGEEVSH